MADIEKELAELRESQERGKVSVERSVSEASLHLQEQVRPPPPSAAGTRALLRACSCLLPFCGLSFHSLDSVCFKILSDALLGHPRMFPVRSGSVTAL